MRDSTLCYSVRNVELDEAYSDKCYGWNVWRAYAGVAHDDAHLMDSIVDVGRDGTGEAALLEETVPERWIDVSSRGYQ